ALIAVFLFAPIERTMGIVQKIFYFHLGSAAASFLAFTVVVAASVVFLITRQPQWDIIAVSAAEAGVLFCTLVLITGPLWARPVWGQWWVWDPRLTTTLILWFLYVGYLVVRQAVPGSRGQLAAAVYGILAYVDVPIVYFSIRWWRGIHPQVLQRGGGLAPGMVTPLLISVAAFALLLLVMIRERAVLGGLGVRVERLEQIVREEYQ
ncbi:cytochrome C assembly protein, partial [bacterium]